MRKFGVLVISHGSRSQQWVELVDDAVRSVELPDEMPIYSSYLEIVEGRLIQDGIYVLDEQGVTDLVVLPLFISSGSTHIDEIQYALGVIAEAALETDLGKFRVQARVHMGETMDNAPELLARMLYDQISSLSIRPEREKVLVVGHGSVEEGFHQRWRSGLNEIAGRLQEIGGFACVEGAMLLPDQTAPYMDAMSLDADVIVAPLFLSAGYFTEQVIPRRLQGYEYRYNGRAMLPHPLVTTWMERQITGLLQELDAEKASKEQ
jgi:sirohydrochlorin ferrochelatase